MLLQPFLPSVLSQGEVSLILIAGKVSHAIRKTPREGDFRVQDDHGGQVYAHTPCTEEIAFAEAAVAACVVTPLYARVDVLRDEANRLRLIELELIEPELFFRFNPLAADTLAQHIRTALIIRG
jgi:glutathione synthase/RimK-type ligase-like ATP-grasp enzyme